MEQFYIKNPVTAYQFVSSTTLDELQKLSQLIKEPIHIRITMTDKPVLEFYIDKENTTTIAVHITNWIVIDFESCVSVLDDTEFHKRFDPAQPVAAAAGNKESE